MDNTIESAAPVLVSLEDDQLELVAGGCGHRRRHGHEGHGYPGYGRNIDIELNIIVFTGNTIQAGGDVEVDLGQDNN
jgi:hypothetical protein